MTEIIPIIMLCIPIGMATILGFMYLEYYDEKRQLKQEWKQKQEFRKLMSKDFERFLVEIDQGNMPDGMTFEQWLLWRN